VPELNLGAWVESAVGWLQAHLSSLFEIISNILTGMFDGLNAVLAAPAPLLMAGILAVIAFWLRGLLAGVLAMAGFVVIDSVKLWDEAMATLALVLVASVITLVVAVPVGIWAARSRGVSAAVRPVLDFMQTMPAFVYLIPGVVFFSIGVVPGLIATIVFSMPPGVRMTEFGIRQVDAELVEAAEAFGTHPAQTLTRVQFPLALPTIMAGVNQVIMLALSMVVIAGMAGAQGLGQSVYSAVTQVDIGLGFESGLGVVILAMYLDRITGALGRQVSPLGRRALAKAAVRTRTAKFAHYRPGTAVAVVGVVVLALVAGGMSFVSEKGEGTVPTAVDVGHGKAVTIGYMPWDEAIATTFLWQEILRERGYKAEVEQLDPGPLFTGLAKGDVDFETDVWLPTTHKAYWHTYGSQLADLGPWYRKTSLELSVPSYVKGVNSLADLKGKSSMFGGRIIGIESSAGEMHLLNSKVLKAYGLDGEYRVVASSTATMLAELQRSYRQKKPVVVPLWSPHWAYAKYDLRKLTDPKHAWGGQDAIHTATSKAFKSNNPTVVKWLKNFRMTEKQLTSLEAKIQDAGKGHEPDAVKAWLSENPGFVDTYAPVR
jgi:glycine betaine/proline transport system substrate-binding protein